MKCVNLRLSFVLGLHFWACAPIAPPDATGLYTVRGVEFYAEEEVKAPSRAASKCALDLVWRQLGHEAKANAAAQIEVVFVHDLLVQRTAAGVYDPQIQRIWIWWPDPQVYSESSFVHEWQHYARDTACNDDSHQDPLVFNLACHGNEECKAQTEESVGNARLAYWGCDSL